MRRARQRRSMLLRLTAAALAIAALWIGWASLSHSQLFKIEHVNVTGNERLSSEDVIAQASIPPAATLLGIDKDDIGNRLLKNPWISGVRVKRHFPATLVIEVKERVPVALVDSGVSFWFVDGDARVLAETTPATSTVLPVIRDLPDFVAEPGKTSESATLRNALAILRGVSSDLLGTVRLVSAPSRNETALLTANSVEIMIGEAVQLKEKSILVKDILAERGSEVVFIDVRSVERPVSRGLGQ